MTIVDKIRNSIQSAIALNYGKKDSHGQVVLEPIEVYYHDDPTLNLMTSDMRFPCVLFQLLTQGNVLRDTGNIRERVTAAVFFVEPSDFDFEAVQNEAIIDRCKQRAFAWLASLNASTEINLYSINRTTRVYDRYDDILTGFGVNVELTELSGVCV